MQPVIYTDLRCLQDENYSLRGIGRHVSALLRAREQSAFAAFKAVGFVDSQLPEISSEFASLVDEITYSTNPCCIEGPAIFLDGSPMGHDMRFSARLVNRPAFFRAAVVYDFIPLDWPGYLPTSTSRVDYLARLARLKKFDYFFPLSDYTARRAAELLGVSQHRMIVTGAAVRRVIYEVRDRLTSIGSPYDRRNPYFFAIFGGDVRKNIELVVTAMKQLNQMSGKRIPLKVAGHYDVKGSGHYDEACRRNLLRLAGQTEGDGFLEFCPGVSDEELVALYAGAVATVVPSHIEGFSLPVAEAAACGCPVVASTCDAHLELINQPEALFNSNDAAGLCDKLDKLLNSPCLRNSLKDSQAQLAKKFHENAVGQRLWTGLEAALVKSTDSPALARQTKPRLAFLGPYPPDQAGAALCTANGVHAGDRFFNADVYSNASRPLAFAGSARDAGRISLAPIVSGRYDGIVSIIGDSQCDPDVLAIFQRFGGPCILHDSPPFLESIIKRARPLMVHTTAEQSDIKSRYSADAQRLPCCPTKLFSERELSSAARTEARERLGIPTEVFFISTFGAVTPDTGMHACIAAIDLLRSWNIPAELYFAGETGTEAGEVNRIACLYGIAEKIHLSDHSLDEGSRRDFLIASDAAVQVRNFRLGRPAASLMDCISAGLPCVTNRHMALACDAPPYIRVVPDRFSPLQIAEQLALIWECGAGRESHAEARSMYLEKHNFTVYARRLLEILAIA